MRGKRVGGLVVAACSTLPILGGAGDDYVSLPNDGVADHVSCGDGVDRVGRSTVPDPMDAIDSDCEVVS